MTLRGPNSNVPGPTKCSQGDRARHFIAGYHGRMRDI